MSEYENDTGGNVVGTDDRYIFCKNYNNVNFMDK